MLPLSGWAEGGLLRKMVELWGFCWGKASSFRFTLYIFIVSAAKKHHLAPVFLLLFKCLDLHLAYPQCFAEGRTPILGGSVDSGGKSSIQKQHSLQFALLKHPLSKSSGCLKGLDIMTHLSGYLRIYQESPSEQDLCNEAQLYHELAWNTFSVPYTQSYRDQLCTG